MNKEKLSQLLEKRRQQIGLFPGKTPEFKQNLEKSLAQEVVDSGLNIAEMHFFLRNFEREPQDYVAHFHPSYTFCFFSHTEPLEEYIYEYFSDEYKKQMHSFMIGHFKMLILEKRIKEQGNERFVEDPMKLPSVTYVGEYSMLPVPLIDEEELSKLELSWYKFTTPLHKRILNSLKW